AGRQGSEQFGEANTEAKDAYKRLIGQLAALEPPAEPILYDVTAISTRHSIEGVADALAGLPGTPEALRQHLMKWRGKVSRLVLLFHIIECVSKGEDIRQTIGSATVERVKAFMLRFLLPNARRFYEEFFAASVADLRHVADRILADKADAVTLRDLRRD